MKNFVDKPLNFSVDARTILQLGRDSIKNPTTAVIELVKNGYDADATSISVDIQKDVIRIFDNGSGMSFETLSNNWLRIGYSDKKKNTYSLKNRRKTGEKGIGRISADRLGESLTLITKTKDGPAVQLSVQWNDFDIEGADLSQVPVYIKALDKFSSFQKGTEIIIHGLRQDWQKADIERLYIELSMLVSPFVTRDELQISFHNHLLSEYNKVVETTYDNAAELLIEASYDGKSNYLDYKLIDKTSGTREHLVKRIKLNQLTQDSLGAPTDHFSCGPAKLEILFFSRSSDFTKGKGLSLSDLRKFLDINAGIKIYRDDISVKPFGYYKEPGGDWLGLAQRRERDPAGLSRPTYKVASYQLVGAVSVGRDTNPWLTDGASREGLVENEAFNDLRNFTLSCVYLLEQYRHSQSTKKRAYGKDKQTAVEKTEEIKQNFDELKNELSSLNSRSLSLDDNTKNKIEQVIEKFEQASRHINDVLDENRVLRGLATIGISTAVFGHETQSTISRLKSQISSAYNALTLKKPVDIDRAVTRLTEADNSAYHVSKWGQFALSRVKKDKRTRKQTDVDKIVLKLLDEINDVFANSNITLKKDIDPINSKVFVMDVESVLLNLLTNAYAFAGTSSSKQVRVELKTKDIKSKKGFVLIVADSGPGVDEEMIETIWEPLVSTKKDRFGYDVGTGLGLTIVSSTVSDLGGEYYVDKDDELGGARFTIWLPVNGGGDR